MTAAALFLLQNEAFIAYKEEMASDHLDVKSFDEWCGDRETKHPQFLYWSKSSQIRNSFPPIHEITKRRKLSDVCGGPGKHHTMSFSTCKGPVAAGA